MDICSNGLPQQQYNNLESNVYYNMKNITLSQNQAPWRRPKQYYIPQCRLDIHSLGITSGNRMWIKIDPPLLLGTPIQKYLHFTTHNQNNLNKLSIEAGSVIYLKRRLFVTCGWTGTHILGIISTSLHSRKWMLFWVHTKVIIIVYPDYIATDRLLACSTHNNTQYSHCTNIRIWKLSASHYHILPTDFATH